MVSDKSSDNPFGSYKELDSDMRHPAQPYTVVMSIMTHSVSALTIMLLLDNIEMRLPT